MRHLLLTVQYNGRRYHGFQVQKNALSVAQAIQDAVQAIFGSRLPVKGCSRTDAGVHAGAFALSLRTSAPVPCAGVVRGMNAHLPGDVSVLDCREVPETFHPRYSCKAKRYVYRVWNASVKNPFLEDTAMHEKRCLDEKRMGEAARFFLGRHDFSAFCSAGGGSLDHEREIFQAQVFRKGSLVFFSVTGSGFLYNMVRIMTGTLFEVSRGALAPGDIPDILKSADRKRAGPTAPPHGLFLDDVFYPPRALGLTGDGLLSLQSLAAYAAPASLHPAGDGASFAPEALEAEKLQGIF